ncbi:MAG: galactokinase [Fusobacteriaceae bacterium]
MIDNLKKIFENKYGPGDYKCFFSPGRVNLIGEHTDYNGGHVFPCALSFGTYGIARLRDDKLIRVYSNNFSKYDVMEFSIDNLSNEKEHNWANYCKGVIQEFKKLGYSFDRGLELVIEGNIPNGAGLSSSASIEILTAVIIKTLYNIDIDMIEMIKISQRAENIFVGVNCGIMDQFAIGMGKENSAILLDCNTLKYEYVNLELGDNSIVIINTNKKRGLADSKYNERREQCEIALAELQKVLSVKSLGELSIEEFEKNKHLIKDDINRKRAKHAVYENVRTLEAVTALNNKDMQTFGRLMNESHISLRDDYEVTGEELDSLVAAQWRQEGVIGARMTGAGFGGCTVAIVQNDKIDKFIENVSKEYTDKTSLKATFYIGKIGPGAKEIDVL